MIDLGEFTPDAAYGPLRAADGTTKLGRLTTTQEQHDDAVRHILAGIRKTPGEVEGKSKVVWSRAEPTTLVVTATIEHTPSQFPDVYIPEKVVEYIETGAEIHHTAAERSAQLVREVTELAEKGQL